MDTKEMINPDLIPAINPGELRGNSYQYLDDKAELGKSSYFWVEWVGDGYSEFHGPVSVFLPRYTWLPSLSR